MNPIGHYLVVWALAVQWPGLRRFDRALIVAGGLAPDLDGLGIFAEFVTRHSEPPLYWWSEYHHTIGHNACAGLVVGSLAWLLSRRPMVAMLALASFHLHLLADLAGGRGPDGYQWPIPYLWPLRSDLSLTVPWQWQLNAWPNVAISVTLMAYALWAAWSLGRSPLEPLWLGGDRALVGALRGRFGLPAAQG